MNFQQCYNLQYIIDGANDLNLFQGNRLLVKQGPIYKVSKRSGEPQLRFFSLFSDMLLVCKVDKLKKSLKLNYEIKTQDIKLIENTSESNSNDENEELKFRIISNQNNQFLADSKRHKEDWLKAFRKVKNLKIIQTRDTSEIVNIAQIGKNPPIWIPDPLQNECSGCREAFSLYRRRHHCRTCGKIYCNPCCNSFTHVQFSKKKERVCKNCFYFLDPNAQKPTNNNKNNNNNITVAQTTVSSDVQLSNEQLKNELKQRINKNNKQISNENLIKNDLNSTIPPHVVVRRENKTPKGDESSSSSLTEEQINFIGKILERSDSQELSDELEETNDSSDVSSKNEEASLSLNTETNDSLSEVAESNTSSTSSQHHACLRNGYNRHAVKQKHLETKDSDEHSSVVTNNRSLNSHASKPDLLNRKIILSEYGYLCKIASKGQEANSNEVISERNNLERKYFILYSDNTLGISSNSNEAPNMMIHLNLYKLTSLDDKSFELVKLTNSEEINSSTNINNNDNGEIKERKKLSAIKNMFELNYEIKFTNKDIKNKWCELILNYNN